MVIIRGDPGPWSFFAILLKAITSTHIHDIALRYFVSLAASQKIALWRRSGALPRHTLFLISYHPSQCSLTWGTRLPPDLPFSWAASANLLDIVGTSLPLNHGMVLANQKLAWVLPPHWLMTHGAKKPCDFRPNYLHSASSPQDSARGHPLSLPC